MIALVDYGAGNLRSVEFALERLGLAWRRASTAGALDHATAIILPGVGAAATAMSELESRGLVRPLRDSQLPMLGICLGLQLFTQNSEEGAGRVPCLGVLSGVTRRIGSENPEFGLPLPHIGWNETRLADDPLFDGLGRMEHFYFLHSYRVDSPVEQVIAEVDYGGTFPAAVRSGRRVAVQFHPEKSGDAGLRVLANFCRAGESS
ncbi:MAG: imidazole glycerol phosphate synthase subunit HisH [marine benthic group bacterium]|nr:imidazole glycerol phosphate synthase subunit HisH [Candidatus Carthagonibacter metallireducens]